MDVGENGAFGLKEDHTTDVDFLTDLADHGFEVFADGQAVPGCGTQGVGIGQVVVVGGFREAVGGCDEVFVASHEIGFAVQLKSDRFLLIVGDDGDDHALVGVAVGTLVGHFLAFLAEVLHSGVHVAIGFGQGFLAIHHTRAGQVAQVFHIRC